MYLYICLICPPAPRSTVSALWRSASPGRCPRSHRMAVRRKREPVGGQRDRWFTANVHHDGQRGLRTATMTLIMTFAGEGVGGIHRNPEQLEVIVYTMTWQSKIASTLSKIYAIIVSDTRAQTHTHTPTGLCGSRFCCRGRCEGMTRRFANFFSDHSLPTARPELPGCCLCSPRSYLMAELRNQ